MAMVTLALTETQAGHKQIQIIELNIEVLIRWLVYLIFKIKKRILYGCVNYVGYYWLRSSSCIRHWCVNFECNRKYV